MRRDLLLYLSLVISFLAISCDKLLSDTPVYPELITFNYSPSFITYDTINGNFFDSDNKIVDSISLFATFDIDGNYSATFNGSEKNISKSGSYYTFKYPIVELLSAAVDVGDNIFWVSYFDEDDNLIESRAVTIYVKKGVRLPLLNTFTYSPINLVYDSSTLKVYDLDSVEVDSFEFVAKFDTSGIFNVYLGGVAIDTTALVDSIATMLPLSSILPSPVDYGTYSKTVLFVSNAGDTVGTEEITITVYSKFAEPYYKYCWHLDNFDLGFHENWSIDTGASIHVKKAWEISRGAGVIVAVIDDNFEKAHEDLGSNILEVYNVNTGENEAENSTSSGSHGTTCAGFVASPKNGIGTIGVAPEAKLLLIAEITYSDYNTSRAFDYAKEKGAKVISCSWGSYDVSQALATKLQEMYDAGITVLFANGNDGYDLDNSGFNDESELPSVLGIGASGEENDITSYSNYGSNIELIAPGGDHYGHLGILGIDDSGSKGSNYQKSLVTNNYAFTSGTSFSTPVTAGVVALMLSVNPTLTPLQIRTILIETADKVGGSDANYNASGFDKYRAYGKVNAEKAVIRAAGL